MAGEVDPHQSRDSVKFSVLGGISEVIPKPGMSRNSLAETLEDPVLTNIPSCIGKFYATTGTFLTDGTFSHCLEKINSCNSSNRTVLVGHSVWTTYIVINDKILFRVCLSNGAPIRQLAVRWDVLHFVHSSMTKAKSTGA